MGILCLEMANGKPPNMRSTLRAMYQTGRGVVPTLINPEDWSDEFKSFLTCMLKSHPDERWSAVDLINHKWFERKISPKDVKTVIEQVFVETSMQSLLT